MARVKGEYIPFKVLYDFEDRKRKHRQTLESMESTSKNTVLIILQPHSKSNLPLLGNCRFACGADKTLNYLKTQIQKKKLPANPNATLFLYCGKTMLVGIYFVKQQGDQTMGRINQLYGDPDGFLYITYAEMNCY